MSVLVVTGTDTGVGKTIVTAGLACAARLAGIDVAVCKPVQTGTGHGDDDLADVARLSGVAAVHGLARFPEPLAPLAAAQRCGSALPGRAELTSAISAVDDADRLVLVEGAGGLLVQIGSGATTLRDVARDVAAPVLVVVRAGLGTLNHTALTLEALRREGLRCAGLAIGAWPATPGAVEADNRRVLAGMAPLRAAVPAGAGTLDSTDFAAMSTAVFDRRWVAGLVG